MTTMIRLENVHRDESREIGPFDFVQMTYETMRVGPNGDDFAGYRDGWWILDADGSEWSDVILYAA